VNAPRSTKRTAKKIGIRTAKEMTPERKNRTAAMDRGRLRKMKSKRILPQGEKSHAKIKLSRNT
jgi:hypothetical protein